MHHTFIAVQKAVGLAPFANRLWGSDPHEQATATGSFEGTDQASLSQLQLPLPAELVP